MEDYDFEFQYHLGKANVVSDALSRKTHSMLASLILEDWKNSVTIGDYNLECGENGKPACTSNIVATPSLL